MSCEEPPKSAPVQAPVSKPAVQKTTPVKVTVKEVDTQQTVFTKASKNIRTVMQTLNTAKKSIGSDRMFDATRRQLAKLSELLEIRAFVLDALAEAMTAATGGYKTAQTQGVKVMTECKAHKTDFYGNPVHVSAATGAAGGAAGSVGAAAASAAPVTAEAPVASAAAEPTHTQTVNVTQNATNIVNNYSSAAPSESSAAGMASEPSASVVTPASEPASGGIPVGAAVAGMAGAAVLGGAAYGFAEMTKEKRQEKKQKKENKQLDDQLAAAKQKLQDIEEEENRLRAQITEEPVDSEEEA